MEPVRIGLIGCGNISDVYLENATIFESIEVVACADLDAERAQAKAKQHGVPRVLEPEALLTDPDVEMVLNLTVPNVHGQIALAALENGKAVYNEKPLAILRDEAKRMVDLADEKGLRLGCAPDTFMGAGLQTCRKLVDNGTLGAAVAATAFCVSHGHETWHPNPAFFYKPGGGPLFDMGPYYLTALVNLWGPVASVAAMARTTFPERMITSEPFKGQMITVETPTHITGNLQFANGALATLIMSFDVWAASLPFLEIHGADASLRMPDPNFFEGPVHIRRPKEEDWWPVELAYGYADNMRGIGPADMAYAMRSGRPHRANGQLAYHVVDVMQTILDAAESGNRHTVESTCERPAAMPTGLKPGRLDP